MVYICNGTPAFLLERFFIHLTPLRLSSDGTASPSFLGWPSLVMFVSVKFDRIKPAHAGSLGFHGILLVWKLCNLDFSDGGTNDNVVIRGW